MFILCSQCLVTWQCCSTLSRDWVSIFFYVLVFVYSVAFGHDLVSGSRQSLVYYVLWSVPVCVSLDRRFIWHWRERRLYALYSESYRFFSGLCVDSNSTYSGLWLDSNSSELVSTTTLQRVLFTIDIHIWMCLRSGKKHGFVFSSCTKVQVWLTLTWPWICWDINYSSNKSALTSIIQHRNE